MVLHDGSSSNNMNSGDPIRNRNEGNLGWYKTEEEDTKHSHGSGKWMSSKMRLMKKITSPTSDRFNPRNNTTRVCSDCNTTTTPLWRSGPKGPKVNQSFPFATINNFSTLPLCKSVLL